MFPKPPKLGRTSNTFHFSTCRPSTLPFLSCRWIQASMKRCASMMCMESLGSGYMGNRPSSWVCGSDEEMMGDVSFSDFFSWIQLIKLWVCSETCHWLLPPLWQRLPRRPVRSSTTRSASLPLPLSAHLQRVHVPAWSGCRVSNLNPEKLRIFDACQMVIFLRWFIMDIFLPHMMIWFDGNIPWKKGSKIALNKSKYPLPWGLVLSLGWRHWPSKPQ